jgi:hypothetical protein
MKPQIWPVFGVLALFTVTPSLVNAQITRTHEQIEAQIERGVDCYMNPDLEGCYPDCDRSDPNDPDCPEDTQPSCRMYWRSSDHVSVTRASASAVDAEIRLACDINNFTDPDVTIKVQLKFSCNGTNPSIRVSPHTVGVDVNFPWYIDVLSASVTWWIGNIRSRTETANLYRHAVELFASSTGVDPLQYCPGIAVQSNGDVVFDLSQGNECTSGETRHRRCPSNHHGSGIDEVCVGGRWALEARDCEPNAPPGGEPL